MSTYRTNGNWTRFMNDLRKANNNDIKDVLNIARKYRFVTKEEWNAICRRMCNIKTKDDFELIWAAVNRMERKHDGAKNNTAYMEMEYRKDIFFYKDALIHFLYQVIGF